LRLYSAVVRSLQDFGVSTMFGLIGDANMQLISEFTQKAGGRFIGTAHESGAAAMADGYARFSGRLGVATVTYGPGFTNTLTALTEAVRARSSVVVITGDAPHGHAQELDLRAAASVTGAQFRRISDPASASAEVAKALTAAREGRRPVVLDVPAALQDCDVEYPVPTQLQRSQARLVVDEASLDRALGVIASARRPIVLAGRGAVRAREALVDLAGILGAPLATTLLGKDMFRGHPWNLDIVGTVGRQVTLDAFAAADCIAVFGASLARETTVNGGLFNGKAVVQCDSDLSAIGRHQPVTALIQGDAAKVATAMSAALAAAGHRPGSFASAGLRDELAQAYQAEASGRSVAAGPVDARTVTIWLDERLPARRFVITDGGRCKAAPWRYFHVPEPERFTHTINFGSIGLSLAAAVGGAAADADGVAICFTGDGSCAMAMMEFSTAVRHRLPLVVVVLNDQSYGLEYDKLEQLGLDPATALCDWPDFAELARAMGGSGIALCDASDFDKAGEVIAAGRWPLLIDVRMAAGTSLTSSQRRHEVMRRT
jgi:acetolactate synthase I/II/III large subunit